MTDLNAPFSRRRALALGGTMAGGLVAASLPLASGTAGASTPVPANADRRSRGRLPVKQIEAILQGPGMVMDGVLSVTLDRDDLTVTGPGGIPFDSAFQVNGTSYFQPLGDGVALLNGDFPLRPAETNPFIDQLLAHGIVLQAFHQHYFDLSPMVYFQHFRAVGDPLRLAKGVAAAIKVTGTPLPQMAPANPTTPLDAHAIGKILGGTPTVGSSGVVTVNIPRAETITLAGVPLNKKTGTNTAAGIAFEPLGSTGQHAAAGPDFSLLASEVEGVVKVMRAQGFTVHCLYNQETDEHPQLYFSHMLATGNALDLAAKIRRGLDRTNVTFTS